MKKCFSCLVLVAAALAVSNFSLPAQDTAKRCDEDPEAVCLLVPFDRLTLNKQGDGINLIVRVAIPKKAPKGRLVLDITGPANPSGVKLVRDCGGRYPVKDVEAGTELEVVTCSTETAKDNPTTGRLIYGVVLQATDKAVKIAGSPHEVILTVTPK